MLYKNYKSIIWVVVLAVLTSCDLELVPEAELSNAVFWKTSDDFRQGTNYLYKAMEISQNDEEAYPLYSDVITDNAVANGGNDVANGSFLPSSNFGPWNQDYRIIRAANNILEQADISGLETLEDIKGEARFFRAYAYADLLRRYGGVPLIMKTLDVSDEELYNPRSSREEVIQAIYTDLDFATANLPLKRGSGQFGLATASSALTLKARVALREGTWNKFHNAGDSAGHLQTAKATASTIMNGAAFELYDLGDPQENYKKLFKTPGVGGAGNKEVIWAYTYGIDVVTRIQPFNFSAAVSNGNLGVSKSLVDAYVCTDGLPIDISPLYEGRDTISSEFVNRDPRLNGTVIKKGDPYLSNLPYKASLVSITGYPMSKYFDILGNDVHRYLDMMLMRYGEVLLIYAEATFELDENISDSDLDLSINLLRDRVGVAHLTNALVSDNGLDMRTEIRRERRVELGLEGFRYDDLIRWKTAETEIPKPLKGARIFNGQYAGVDVNDLTLDSDSILIVEDMRTFDASKHYLWPLPLTQIALNPNLDQNPNW